MTLNSTVVIFIQDYLKTEENLMMSSNSTPLSSNYSKQSEVITFPSQAEEVTKEEIGKWVDLLMEMPEPGNSGSDFMNKGLEQFDDPLSCVAERILSEENLR